MKLSEHDGAGRLEGEHDFRVCRGGRAILQRPAIAAGRQALDVDDILYAEGKPMQRPEELPVGSLAGALVSRCERALRVDLAPWLDQRLDHLYPVQIVLDQVHW